MERSNFDIIIGSAPRLRFRLTKPEDVTNWTTQFTMTDPASGAIVYQADGTITNPDMVAHSDTLGVFDVPLSKAITNTFSPKSYRWAFWRTNTGFEDPLASGDVFVKKL
jgi:hypothetical protein